MSNGAGIDAAADCIGEGAGTLAVLCPVDGEVDGAAEGGKPADIQGKYTHHHCKKSNKSHVPVHMTTFLYRE